MRFSVPGGQCEVQLRVDGGSRALPALPVVCGRGGDAGALGRALVGGRADGELARACGTLELGAVPGAALAQV